ncbi:MULTISPECIES: TRAP transporter large permease subunit [Thermus]|uniref:C4-dicarboxylate ABC transporter n=2 Tax=Thermus scotoductus TaxID=37636 RepID=A0A0N0IQF0_THESC|nr:MULTISPECIES: TRAP transporter large permease subunit [Thermus]ADW20670.1 tripartite transporter, large subunit [Thermus scotoductus SA-01]KPD29710.1 C4-dicarboxylate ABC transporter [Thermus scotoductus]
MNLESLMPPLMFLALVVFLLSGYPVAFSLGAVGIVFGFLGIALDIFPAPLLKAMPDRIFGIMSNQLLLAIPFFTFMGIILEKSGLAEDLLDTMGKLFGPLRGGLALSVVFVGAILAATTGVVAASVMAMGLISLPIMLKYGYNPRFASGVILGSATLAQIIPPSVVLIVLSDQLGVSVGDMYKAALIPSALTVGFYFLYVIYVALFRPKWVPALPPEARPEAGKEAQAAFALLSYLLVGVGAYAVGRFLPAWAEWLEVLLALGVWTLVLLPWIRRNPLLRRALLSMVPPLVLIFLVLGTVLIGLATPTEAGAMGVVGALILAALNRRLSFQVLYGAMEGTAKLTAFVIFILIGSTLFSLVFRGVNGDLWVEGFLTGLPGGEVGFILFVMVLVFLLGFFIDFFEIAFIALPLLAIGAEALNIDKLWFGLLVGVNLQTSFLTPPFGFALFYLRNVAPKEVKTTDIYLGGIPFIGLQLLVLLFVYFLRDPILRFVSGMGFGG